ncbi:hypothetical protein EVAR_85684_1 [Eumeta japonica]|uniref:Uncharacterized protein n=1 Tax=Eumeta variegata TaxID=151549 RepID=A0A4C1WC66_EUMVA|nr:hypothetical protein EVAR_85684_1 [Eumeta japonica]
MFFHIGTRCSTNVFNLTQSLFPVLELNVHCCIDRLPIHRVFNISCIVPPATGLAGKSLNKACARDAEVPGACGGAKRPAHGPALATYYNHVVSAVVVFPTKLYDEWTPPWKPVNESLVES